MRRGIFILPFLTMMTFGDTVGPLPPCAYADTEVSTNMPFAVETNRTDRFELTISLSATCSNCVEIAVGTDADADGILSLEEADLAFGYDCGNWFVRDSSVEMIETEAAAGLGRQTRTFALWLHEIDCGWDRMRVVRRGAGVSDETVTADRSRKGIAVGIR